MPHQHAPLRGRSKRTRAAAAAACALALVPAVPAAAQQRAPDDARAAASVRVADDDLRRVQRRLGVRADGVMGPRTRRAIRRFQRRKGLEPDGVVGPATLRALGLSASSSSRRSPRSPDDLLERIAQCESGGDPTAVSPGGRYRGKYQFARSTWRALGGSGDPAEAPERVQDRLARKLLATQGPSAWPVCSRA